MDAALVNNWEEMSETYNNMQQYTNVFMSWYSVGGWMLFHRDGVKQENAAWAPKHHDVNTFSFCCSLEKVFLVETDITRFNVR